MEQCVTISEFSFRLILIFVPGILCYWLIESLTNTVKANISFFSVRSFVFGFLAYAVDNLLRSVVVDKFKSSYLFETTFEDLIVNNNEISLLYISYICGIACVLGLVFSFIIQKRFLYRFALLLRITNKSSDSDIWSNVHQSDQTDYSWVYIRDYGKKIVIRGWVYHYSSDFKTNELLLRDVTVYDFEGGELYSVPALYYTAKHDQLYIEFPKAIENVEELPCKLSEKLIRT